METKKQKIARYEKLQKHYRCALWEAEKTGNWGEASKIKPILFDLESYLEKLLSN